MKIKFENFIYYGSKNFEIPDEGLYLLHGKNGSGKSTILKGICHAFFGNIEKPYKHGTKECTVYLEYKDLVIKRHNNPSYLIVQYKGDKYEGKSAQGVINDYLGLDKHSFVSSSWFKDSLGSSIISLPPCEQLEFIEKIIFESSNHKKYLDGTNSKIKTLKDEILRLEGEINAYEKEISTKNVEPITDEYIEEVKNNISSLKKQDDEYSSTIYECSKFIKLNRQKSDRLKNEIERQKKVKEKLQSLETNINSLEEELSDLSKKVMTEDELQENESKISLCKDEIFNLKSFLKYKEYLDNYKKLKDNYLSEKDDKIFKLKEQLDNIGQPDELQKKLEKQKDHENYMTILKTTFSKFKKLYPDQKINSVIEICSFITEKIEDKVEILKELQTQLYKSSSVYQTSHNCPSCNESLIFNDTELVVGDENEFDGHIIQKYQKELRQKHYLEFILRDFKYFSKMYKSSKNNDLREKLFESKKIIQNIEDIENEKVPNSILEFKNKVLDMKKNIPKGFKFNGNIETKINKLNEELESLKEIKSVGWIERSRFIRKEKNLKSARIDLIKYQKSVNNSDLDSELQNVEKEIDSMNENIFEYQNLRNSIMKELQEYSSAERKIKEYEDYMKLKNTLDRLISEYKELNLDCKSYLRFRDCLKKAKLLAVEDMVRIINNHSKKYLESMFSEPIDIKLYIDYTSDTLKIKNKMIYNGEVYSKLNEFSHGERQRIVLCFLLSVNDALGSKILMLDESFTNVDHETYTEIISSLKNFNLDKLTLVVSQKIYKGIFDNHFHFKKLF